MAKITTGELYNEWQQINNKLELLNNKVDGIIEGDAVNTRLTGSITKFAEFEDVVIPPGDTIDILAKNSSKPFMLIKVNFRIIEELNYGSDFRVVAEYYMRDETTVTYAEQVDLHKSDYYYQYFKGDINAVTPIFRVKFFNRTESDINIRRAVFSGI